METTKDNRPDPEELLKNIKANERKERSGKLKLFFGMCAGVGKTYTMLEAGRKAVTDGTDVVIGIVETHDRADTESLTNGMERVPLKNIEYRSAQFSEMDLDGILNRNPKLVLVDELAHTNIPGSRHVKRYQDVLELLSQGIDVYTTLNVQHLESRAETVRQITGAVIRETIPDSILDKADEIELVDITPDELLKRLIEGKVYTPEKSRTAIKNFFRKGNLTALREMSLRITAEHVDWQLRDYMVEKKIAGTWKSGQRLMVAIGPSPYSAELIRWTRRLAFTMEASWIAVYVETEQDISDENRNTLSKNFNIARELGAEIITTADTDIARGLLRIAGENNITHLIIGKSGEKKLFRNLLKKDLVNRLIEDSKDIDVYLVGGIKKQSDSSLLKKISFHSKWQNYLLVSSLIALFSLCLTIFVPSMDYHTVSMLFLLLVALLPLFNMGPGPILLAALLSAISWDFFFIPPRFTLHIGRLEDIMMFVMFFIVAIVTGYLSARVRTQEKFVRLRESRTAALYNLIKELARAESLDDVAETAVNNIGKVFNCDVAILFGDINNNLSAQPHAASTYLMNDSEWRIAQWVYLNGQKAGKNTNTLPLADAEYYSLSGIKRIYGVIGIRRREDSVFSFEHQILFEHFITQIGSITEREFLGEISKQSLVLSESEKLYKTLFNSISHELKTPVTTIMTALASMTDPVILKDQELTASFASEMNIAVRRLNCLVENLLDMARLESGVLNIKRDWYYIYDLLSSVLNRIREETGEHRIKIIAAEDIGLVKFDFGLLEQAIINIIRNSILYSRHNGEIFIEVSQDESFCKIKITDNGPGFPEGTLSRVFEKFYRVPGTKTGGTGLGLSIAKGFIDAHNGSIEVSNADGGGAVFVIKIPKYI